MITIEFTQDQIDYLVEASARIDVLARVADGTDLSALLEADEERAEIEQALAEILIDAAARAGVEV